MARRVSLLLCNISTCVQHSIHALVSIHVSSQQAVLIKITVNKCFFLILFLGFEKMSSPAVFLRKVSHIIKNIFKLKMQILIPEPHWYKKLQKKNAIYSPCTVFFPSWKIQATTTSTNLNTFEVILASERCTIPNPMLGKLFQVTWVP